MSILSLNKIALISIFSMCAFGSAYSSDSEDSRAVARGEGRGVDQGGRDSRFQDNRNINGYGYGTYGGYGGAGIYPQNPQYPYDAFPDQTEFDNTYERNAHPPR